MSGKQKARDTYGTLARPGAMSHVYHDRDSIPFNVKYPLIEFQDTFVPVAAEESLIHRQLLTNYWYQKANSLERKQMVQRVMHVNANLQIVLDFFERTYGKLGFELLHLSLAGSYAHSPAPGDIDFDAIVAGSFFDYATFNEGIEVLDLTGTVRKVSLTIMGMDNVLGKAFTNDDIRNEGFVHHDTIIREMLVAPMRNITVYGKEFDYHKSTDSRNVLVRIARQLYFAELTLEGKIPYYGEEPLKTRKATKRIREAYEIIDWLLHVSNDI